MTVDRTSSRITHLIKSSLVMMLVRGVLRLVYRLCPVVVSQNHDGGYVDHDKW